MIRLRCGDGRLRVGVSLPRGLLGLPSGGLRELRLRLGFLGLGDGCLELLLGDLGFRLEGLRLRTRGFGFGQSDASFGLRHLGGVRRLLRGRLRGTCFFEGLRGFRTSAVRLGFGSFRISARGLRFLARRLGLLEHPLGLGACGPRVDLGTLRLILCGCDLGASGLDRGQRLLGFRAGGVGLRTSAFRFGAHGLGVGLRLARVGLGDLELLLRFGELALRAELRVLGLLACTLERSGQVLNALVALVQLAGHVLDGGGERLLLVRTLAADVLEFGLQLRDFGGVGLDGAFQRVLRRSGRGGLGFLDLGHVRGRGLALGFDPYGLRAQGVELLTHRAELVLDRAGRRLGFLEVRVQALDGLLVLGCGSLVRVPRLLDLVQFGDQVLALLGELAEILIQRCTPLLALEERLGGFLARLARSLGDLMGHFELGLQRRAARRDLVRL